METHATFEEFNVFVCFYKMCVVRKKSEIESSEAKAPSDFVNPKDIRVLANRSCSMAESVKWAFSYFRVGAEPKDAPSLVAWRLYEEGKRNPVVLIDMFMEVAKKQAQQEDDASRRSEWDGEKQWNVLKNLRESL